MFGWFKVKKAQHLDSLIYKRDLWLDFEEGTIKMDKGLVILTMEDSRYFAADILERQFRMAEIQVRRNRLMDNKENLDKMPCKNGLQFGETLQSCLNKAHMEYFHEFDVRGRKAQEIIYRYWDKIKHHFPNDIVIDMKKYQRYQLA